MEKTCPGSEQCQTGRGMGTEESPSEAFPCRHSHVRFLAGENGGNRILGCPANSGGPRIHGSKRVGRPILQERTQHQDSRIGFTSPISSLLPPRASVQNSSPGDTISCMSCLSRFIRPWQVQGFPHSRFGFVSDFELRISNFHFVVPPFQSSNLPPLHHSTPASGERQMTIYLP